MGIAGVSGSRGYWELARFGQPTRRLTMRDPIPRGSTRMPPWMRAPRGRDIMTDPQTAGEPSSEPLQPSTQALASEMLEPAVARGLSPPYEVLLGAFPSGGFVTGSDGEA